MIIEKEVKEEDLIQSLSDIQLQFRPNAALRKSEMFLNGKNVETEIRKMEVSENVSQIAVIKEVRKKLVALQQRIGLDKGIVMDGRDIGTVVFPNAEIKFFITADKDIRAQRRYEELISKGKEVTIRDL